MTPAGSRHGSPGKSFTFPRRGPATLVLATLALATLALAADAEAAGSTSRRARKPSRLLKGGFGLAPHAVPEAIPPSKRTITISGSPAPAPTPCNARDPEDGSCHASLDAADVAWLARGPVDPNAPLPLMDPEDDEEELVALEDEEEAEDGGPLAPIDASHPTGEPTQAVAAKPSFWRTLASRFTGAVRRSDSLRVSLPEAEIAALFAASFPLPVEKLSTLQDSFFAKRGRHRRHHAIDMPAPRGTPVVAVVDGVIERLGRDRRGGKVCYLRGLTGRYTFYYAHLATHEKGLRTGDRVKKGQRLGTVGATGHATGPHLHFAIFRDAEKSSPVRALAVNPYLIFASLMK